MDPSQLRDIHAILGNPWWPLAPGWWLLAATALGIGLILWGTGGSWRLRVPIPFITLGDWRWEAGRELRRLRRPPPGTDLKARVADLSELLRRIAMARHGRPACARLSGPEWLDWLASHDPRGFDWRQHGRLLLATPYAPAPPPGTDTAALNRLLDATEVWITVRPPRPAGRLARWMRRPGRNLLPATGEPPTP